MNLGKISTCLLSLALIEIYNLRDQGKHLVLIVQFQVSKELPSDIIDNLLI